MSKKIKYYVAKGIIFSMFVSIFSQKIMAENVESQMEIMNIESKELELIESSNENGYVVLSDVGVESELEDDETVKITLSNTGAFSITDWVLVYEASYDIISAENTEVVMNSQVKELKALEVNNTLESGDFITITIKIDGIYSSNEEYRVYGLCDGISGCFSVVDYITYNASTEKTSFTIYDEYAVNDVPDSICTQGLDIATTNTEMIQTDIAVPLKVIGSDDREKVNTVDYSPYNKIACLIIKWSNGTKTKTSMGTGFMIGSNHMLTAAHCVYDKEWGVYAKSITAYFGANGVVYSKAVSASEWSCCSSYPSDFSADNDWGCVKLSSNPGRGYFSLTSSTSGTATVTICGYPGDKKVESESATIGNYLRYMYKMSGRLRTVDLGFVTYTIDTYRGQSGSPIYNSSNQVLGIHCQASDLYDYNLGCRITPTMIDLFMIKGWCE